jgi:DNA-binding response OmpR family regulator
MLRPRPGTEITEATTARDAKRLLVDEDFDVLLIDGDLAPQGGFSFLYEFHQRAEQEGLVAPPAIVLTARAEDRWLADWAQAAGTLPKPVDPFDVAAAVDEVLAATS